MLAGYLSSAEFKNAAYEIDTEPCIMFDETGEFMVLEPYFEYVIKELPYIFPEDWYETTEGEILHVLDQHQTLETSLDEFFAIQADTFFHLLFPGRQNIYKFAGKMLTKTSTPLDIAINIFELVIKESENDIISQATNTIFLN
jgi:hypothetical protein